MNTTPSLLTNMLYVDPLKEWHFYGFMIIHNAIKNRQFGTVLQSVEANTAQIRKLMVAVGLNILIIGTFKVKK